MTEPAFRAARPLAILLAALAVTTPAEARLTERVKTACASDYLQFCGQYPPESFQTIDCMKKNARRLTRVCRNAVEEDGVPASSSRRRRRN
jgi:hypothetical protein